jgi:hypothetical protein
LRCAYHRYTSQGRVRRLQGVCFRIVTITDLSSGGFIGGGQIDYNFQASNFVYGLEADFQESGIKANLQKNILGFNNVNFGPSLMTSGRWRRRHDRIGTCATVCDERLAYGHTKTGLTALVGSGAATDLKSDKTRRTSGAVQMWLGCPAPRLAHWR